MPEGGQPPEANAEENPIAALSIGKRPAPVNAGRVTIERPEKEGKMASQLGPVTADQLGLGDHVAFFFKSNAERFAFVIPYVINGLRNHERCVYIAHENSLSFVRDQFKRAGVDVDAANANGALSIVTTHDSYLRYGIFEPERMIHDFDRDVRLALQLGFKGLRATGEMTWALDLPSAFSKLCEYEEQLCRKWPTQLGGLCQYNEPLFPADLMQRMPGWHCTVVRGGNISQDHTHRAA